MYQSYNAKTGVAAVSDWMTQFKLEGSPDGLTFLPPGGADPPFDKLAIPPRLFSWLLGLRLLKNLPLSYLVPDPELLPPESIRFFHVDYTWVDRVIDGAFAAANTGTVDSTFQYWLISRVRAELDAGLQEIVKDWLKTAKEDSPDPAAFDFVTGASWAPGTNPLTGLLIRSELTRRWPDMIVEAYSDANGTKCVAPLRREPISTDVFIALFAGQPLRVDIREPKVGVRFGVERDDGKLWVDIRGTNGSRPGGRHPVTVSTNKVIDLAGADGLKQKIEQKIGANAGARMIALHLEQLAYVQTFRSNVAEDKGSLRPPLKVGVAAAGDVPIVTSTIPLSRGRTANLAKLVARLDDLEMEKV
jgi:hypothetical protein